MNAFISTGENVDIKNNSCNTIISSEIEPLKSSYYAPINIETSNIVEKQITEKEKSRDIPKPKHPVSSQIYAINKYIGNIKLNVNKLVDATNEDDRIDKGNAGMLILECLGKLWEYRGVQPESWGMIINFLQCALYNVIFEDITIEQSNTIKTIFEKYLHVATDSDDINGVLESLENIGFDPWQVLSGFRE